MKKRHEFITSCDIKEGISMHSHAVSYFQGGWIPNGKKKFKGTLVTKYKKKKSMVPHT